MTNRKSMKLKIPYTQKVIVRKTSGNSHSDESIPITNMSSPLIKKYLLFHSHGLFQQTQSE